MPTDFTPGPAQPADGAPLFSGEALLDAEKLDCYRLEFQALATRLVPRRNQAVLRDQLDRASVSIVLNIAEGAGRVSPADKARFLCNGSRQRHRMRGRHRPALGARPDRPSSAKSRARDTGTGHGHVVTLPCTCTCTGA
jgi:hypothetical protein